MQTELLTVKELAKWLRCSESCIRKLKREKIIPVQKGIASKVLFNKKDIDEYLEKNKKNIIESEGD